MIREQGPLEKLAILHATDEDIAREVAAELTDTVPGGDPLVAQLGPVVGNYLGPGLLGFGLIRAKGS